MNEEHALARVGKLTASRLADAVAKTKTGWGASRDRYMAELTVERLTGQPYPQRWTTAAMQRGIEMEPEAFRVYARRIDLDTDLLAGEVIGFVPHPTIKMSGASPDGYVGTDGLIEIKCPDSHTHYNTLLTGFIAGEYITQMMWQMACTGRQWCDWISFDPVWPPHLQLYVRRFERDDKLISILEQQAREFLVELEARMLKLDLNYSGVAAFTLDDPAVLHDVIKAAVE